MENQLNLKVLVVDDNQINRLLLNKLLQRWGISSDFAENGLQAVEKIEGDTKYDAVLMDIHMPEMNGLEATQAVRAKPDAYFKELPIIALTASMMSSEIKEMDDAGMNGHISKPFEPKDLFEKLSLYKKDGD